MCRGWRPGAAPGGRLPPCRRCRRAAPPCLGVDQVGGGKGDIGAPFEDGEGAGQGGAAVAGRLGRGQAVKQLEAAGGEHRGRALLPGDMDAGDAAVRLPDGGKDHVPPGIRRLFCGGQEGAVHLLDDPLPRPGAGGALAVGLVACGCARGIGLGKARGEEGAERGQRRLVGDQGGVGAQPERHGVGRIHGQADDAPQRRRPVAHGAQLRRGPVDRAGEDGHLAFVAKDALHGGEFRRGRGWGVPAASSAITCPISSSGATRSAAPAATAARGISGNSAEAVFWTITRPPAPWSARAPRAPSAPMPVRITPMARWPKLRASEASRRSIGLSTAPRSLGLRAKVPSGSTST